MTQLPESMREWLKENAVLEKPVIMSHITSNDGDTTKLLVKLSDGSLVETVCMHHVYGNSICVSTQVGCAMGCIFCASTRNGLERNLTAGEILAQVYAFRELFDAPIHSIVLMGAGEPLTNYDEVLRFIRLVSDPGLLNISLRNITLSTCGIVPMIDRLAAEGLPITLAISLHAPNDTIRNRILPSSRHFKIEDVVAAAHRYFKKTGRRVTFEYILIKDVNASRENAEELCRLVGKMNCHSISSRSMALSISSCIRRAGRMSRSFRRSWKTRQEHDRPQADGRRDPGCLRTAETEISGEEMTDD